MAYFVRLTRSAACDLEQMCDWIADHDLPAKALHVLDRITSAAENIRKSPHSGSRPPELPPGMEAEYRQVFFKPYRVIYEVRQAEVIVHLIADGRRDLQPLLLRRLAEG
ncbi:MAG TPA: type II toxin-antitoxin system RelE/ParE family toxin [Terracidiphilus sp.]|nr:type II toxin-antitoxin system RelE/ParE family toxin [Terracidiphilus sp.]